MQNETIKSASVLSGRRVGLVMVALGLAILFPQTLFEAGRFALWNLLLVAPAMIIGIAVTAGITASGSMILITEAFRGRQLRMIVLAAFIGALTPVCGITVLPLVAGLLAAGIPLAPIMAFWLSSPITDPTMLTVTAATLGPPFAIGKSLAAFLIGTLGGLVILAATNAGMFRRPARSSKHLHEARAAACKNPGASQLMWRFWRDPDRRKVFTNVARETARLVFLWLSLAFVAEYFLKLYVPEEVIYDLVGRDSPWVVPLSALVGMPIYLDGYAALPLIRGLIESGMRQDAAMAFLVAGGITSAWAAIPVFALVRLPVFFVYLGLALLGSVAAGWGYGFLF